jgi:hypothetical protein
VDAVLNIPTLDLSKSALSEGPNHLILSHFRRKKAAVCGACLVDGQLRFPASDARAMNLLPRLTLFINSVKSKAQALPANLQQTCNSPAIGD